MATFNPDADPVLLGVHLPVPPVFHSDADKVLPSACAQSMALVAEPRGAPYPLLASWGADAKKCMAARLYLKCAEDLLREYMGHKAEAQWMDARYEALAKATHKLATEFKTSACDNVPMPPDSDFFFSVVERAWNKGMAVKLFMAGVR